MPVQYNAPPTCYTTCYRDIACSQDSWLTPFAARSRYRLTALPWTPAVIAFYRHCQDVLVAAWLPANATHTLVLVTDCLRTAGWRSPFTRLHPTVRAQPDACGTTTHHHYHNYTSARWRDAGGLYIPCIPHAGHHNRFAAALVVDPQRFNALPVAHLCLLQYPLPDWPLRLYPRLLRYVPWFLPRMASH